MTMAALAVVISFALVRSAGQPQPEWIGLPITAMFIPLMFIVFAVIVPQRSLRISPHGLCFASTFRRKRRWVRWEEISGVWPGLRRIRKVGGEVSFFHFQALPRSARKELHRQLHLHLAERFDLSTQGEQHRCLIHARKRWTARWLADRATLLGLGLSPFALILLWLWLWTVQPALGFAAVAAMMICMCVVVNQVSRGNWIPPRETLFAR